ncbi:hypothetical protein H2202_000700 [Exophiala xenobiotica]|nr:hypothetical protein H2202_000700 [Exophiala xenobiotica]
MTLSQGDSSFAKAGLSRTYLGFEHHLKLTFSMRERGPCYKTILNGKTVTLEPLDKKHAIDLWPQIKGDERGHIWTYMSDEPYQSLEDFQQAVTTKSQSEDMVFSAIIHNETSKPVGWACYMRVDTKNRVLEVGNILFSPSLQRTKAATESMYIMAKHVFEDLGYRRYEWKCDNHNGPSKQAALRFGFTLKGCFDNI